MATVWLTPAASETVVLQGQIERYTKMLGSPRFLPHITLCTDPVRMSLADVASSSELPVAVTFTAVEFGTDYFHGCYLRAEHDEPLRELQARCVAILGGRAPERYPPHLSLAYGVLSEEQRRATTALLLDLPVRARFDRLELWETGGPVSSWRKLVPV